MIYADQRWIGHHGIGRFARNVLADLDYRSISLSSNPAAPLDAWHLARALAKTTSADLFFSPGYNTPLFCPAQFVFAIHDLSHVYCPENSSPLIRLYYATVMKRACHRAVKILTVSEFTRTQIAQWSGVSPSKIRNVSCGVDLIYRPGAEVYGLPFPYLLSVSNRKRHKNEFRMVAAFAKADLDPRIHLVFTGEPDAALTGCIKQHNVAQRVDFLGVVAEEKLPSLYRGAEGLMFISLYEGFGLPLLEAMACGTPTITSKVTAMPETAGGAALLVDPTSIEQMSEAIAQLVGDRGLRAQLRENGLRRASQFSWMSTRSKVHQVLEETLGAAY
jgi:glycosyltransferase involved in cell wall biosynthesis